MTIKQAVIDLRITHPDWTLEQISQTVKRTKQRIAQILQSEGLETRSTKAAYSRLPSHLKKGKPCLQCGTSITYKLRSYGGGYYPRYCSLICRERYYHIDVTCSNCKKIFVLRRGQVKARKSRNKDLFCSHSCRSKTYWAIVRNERPNTLEYSTNQPVWEASKKDINNDNKTNSN